jgi:hypothetical protein
MLLLEVEEIIFARTTAFHLIDFQITLISQDGLRHLFLGITNYKEENLDVELIFCSGSGRMRLLYAIFGQKVPAI